MAGTDDADSRKAIPAGELFAKTHREATDSRKAPLRGSLFAFEHPREPGERELARLAERQHWCLHRRQLAAAGVGRGGVAGRLQRGQLHRLGSDVYLYGRHELAPLTQAMAVVLHLRGDALLSAEYATWIWQLTDLTPERVIATLVGRTTHQMSAVTLHHVATLHPDDVRWRRGVPLTSPARSLIDFAGSGASVPRIESALAILRRTRLAGDDQIASTLARLPANHRGVPVIRQLLALGPAELALTRSTYERRLRALLRRAGLLTPVSNLIVAGFERDLVWPEAKLIVEFDGWIVHKGSFREDRARDARAIAEGWRVIRLTADRVDAEPFLVIAQLAAALSTAVA